MGFTNSIQRIKSVSLPILVWTNLLLTTLSCIKFHVSYGILEAPTPKTGKKLKPERLQRLSFVAAMMGTTITEDNKGLVLHEFFKNKHLQDRWSRLCSSGVGIKTACIIQLIKLIEDYQHTLGRLDDNEFAPIHYAAKNLNLQNTYVIDLFKTLLHYSKDYINLLSNPRDLGDLELGNTPLHLAARYNIDPKMIQLLIDQGADVHQENDDFYTPLQIAASYNNNPQIIEILIANDADLNKIDLEGDTLLHLAAEYNRNPAVIQALAAVLATKDIRVNDGNNNGETPLHLAAYHGNLPSIKALLNLYANINAEDENGNTPLHLAIHPFISKISKMDVDSVLPIVRELLANSARVDKKNKNGNTLLHEAAMHHDSSAVIQVLIDKGVNVNEENKQGRTPLHLAAMHANLVTTKQFSSLCADVNKQDNDKNTPLHLAVKPIIRDNIDHNHLAVVRELLANGAEINKKNRHGCTPLNIIGNNDRAKPLRELLKAYKDKGIEAEKK